ncbi:hypothetical protein AAG570_005334, partial [Ranatra chinensis]
NKLFLFYLFRFIQLNYNLGSGTVVVTSVNKIRLGEWHRVKVRRYQRDALLQVDNEAPVAGQSQGTLTALDLNQHAYIGYVPTNYTKVFQNAGTHLGLVGCVKLHHQQLLQGQPQLTHQDSEGVATCRQNPCQSMPCLNSGSCFPAGGQHRSSKPVCHCPINFTGEEEVISRRIIISYEICFYFIK